LKTLYWHKNCDKS